MRKILLIIIWICILAILPIVVLMYDNTSIKKDVPYITSALGIEILNVEMKVNKDNSIDVTEYITFNFVDGVPFDGFKFNFPLRDKIDKKRNLKISDISCEDATIIVKKKFYDTEVNVGGKTESMDSGLYTYTLKYHYDLGSNDDDFIYKLFDNIHDLDIFNMNLEITFEDKINKDNVHFISNDEDVTNRVSFGVEENVIRAAMSDFILNKDLLIKVELDDYFKNPKSTDGYIAFIFLIVISLFAIVVVVLNIINHKNIEDELELYMIDIKTIPRLLGLAIIGAFVYIFLNDISPSMCIMYLVAYEIIMVGGLVLLLRLKTK